MLTTVTLDGPMGNRFGKAWELEIDSPAEALRLIEANKPGLRAWIIQQKNKYVAYRVQCEYEDGRTELLDEATYALQRKLKAVRFTPVIQGAGNGVRIVVGAIIIAVSYYFLGPYGAAVQTAMYGAGASLVIGGVIGMLSPQPEMPKSSKDGRDSYYFDGPGNTTVQGVPVQLVYGRCLVGSHAISASVDIDDHYSAAWREEDYMLYGGGGSAGRDINDYAAPAWA